MGIKNLIVFLLLPSLALAQAPADKNAADLFDDQQKIKALSGPDPSCFTCQFAMSLESSRAGQSKVCDDFFGPVTALTDMSPKRELELVMNLLLAYLPSKALEEQLHFLFGILMVAAQYKQMQL